MKLLAAAALLSGGAMAWAQQPAVNGSFAYGPGKRFATVVHQARLLGSLPAEGKEPYLIYAGLGCLDCDINRSVYIDSPSDAPRASGERGPRYSYPGRYRDHQSGELVETVRMFVGRCAAVSTPRVVWFMRTKMTSGRWGQSAYLVRVEGGELVAEFGTGWALSLHAVQQSVARKTCREIPGDDFKTEP